MTDDTEPTAEPASDVAWSHADLVRYAVTLVATEQYAGSLVRITIDADRARHLEDAEPALSASWSLAKEVVERMHRAVESAVHPTIRSALRLRCAQWHFWDSQRPADAHLDGALQAATPPVLRSIMTPATPIDDDGVRAICQAIWDDLDACAADESRAAIWAVHDESGLSRWSVEAGVTYRVGRILIEAEARLRGTYAASFPTMI